MTTLESEGRNEPALASEPHDSGSQGVGIGVVALIALVALLVGLFCGIIVGSAGGFVLGRRTAAVPANERQGISERLARARSAFSERLEERDQGERQRPNEGQGLLWSRGPNGEQDNDAASGADNDAASGADNDAASGGDNDAAADGESDAHTGAENDAHPGESGAAGPPGLGAPWGPNGSLGSFRLARTATRTFLGVRASDPGAAGMTDIEGALVEDVEPASPAAAAGLQPGDVIVALDGEPVGSPDELADAIAARDAGERVSLQILRDGQRLTLDAELASRRVLELVTPGARGLESQVIPFDPSDPDVQELLERLPPEVADLARQMLESLPEHPPEPELAPDRGPDA